MHALVTAASRHEATREIAEAIADGLNRRGVDAEARSVDQVTSLDGFDAVVIGSAIYMGRWLKTARELVSEHAAELSAMPVWLFSSGPLGPPDHLIPEGESADAEQLVDLCSGARAPCVRRSARASVAGVCRACSGEGRARTGGRLQGLGRDRCLRQRDRIGAEP